MNQPEIGTYSPGVVLTVGSHHAKVIKYLTSGGFAQIYTAEIQPADSFVQSNIACLKRVIVPDKPSLNTLRAEVDAMKLLKNNRHVVSYIDSHAAKSSFQNGSYEVFLLMEYCAGGGLIDFMNTRLQNRLQEFEILSIMSQVTQGIAAMHALVPPLIHRDIKIENVLLSHAGEYKVCDFGSVCGVIRPPKNPQEFAFVQHDILKNTTAQYRAPEMIDLYRGHPIDEKADIWALGVFLYKLCYYTTPFEKGGELAIVQSRFQFPAQPLYSDRLKNLIRMMLMVEPSQRPNVCQTLEEVSRMQGVQCPIKNFYLLRAMEQQSNQKHLHYSKTQPILNIPVVNQPILGQSLASQLHDYPAAVSVSPGSSRLVASTSVPQLTQRPSSTGSTGIIRSFLSPEARPQVQKTSSTPDKQMAVLRKVSTASAETFSSGRGNISKIVSANATKYDRPTYVDSVTQTPESGIVVARSGMPTTSASIKGVESSKIVFEKNHIAGKQFSQSHSRSHSPSGDSVSIDSGYSSPADRLVYQISRVSTGNRESKESIQKRVHELLNSSEELTAANQKHDSIKDESRRAHENSKKESGKPKGKPPLPAKPAHLRPNPPPKPKSLIGKRISHLSSGKEEQGKPKIDGDFRRKVSGVL